MRTQPSRTHSFSGLLGLLLLGLSALVGLALGAGPQHGLRGDVLQGQTTAGRDLLGTDAGTDELPHRCGDPLSLVFLTLTLGQTEAPGRNSGGYLK